MTTAYVLVPIGDGSVSVAVEVSDLPAPAPIAPADPSQQIAAENVTRLAQPHPLRVDNMQGHAA